MRRISGLAAMVALILTGCGDPAPAAGAPPAAAAVVVPAPAQNIATTARVPALGLAFEHLPGLTVMPCAAETPSCVDVVDPALTGDEGRLVRVQAFSGPLEAVARAEAGFERDAGGRLMATYGRFEPVAVEAFGEPGRQGLRAVVACGISDSETGFHAAAGECLWAVVSDGTRSVVISSNGFPNGLDVAEVAIRSIRFTPD